MYSRPARLRTLSSEHGPSLRSLRHRAGLTQAELGRRVGTTQSAVARWESGAVSPSLGTVHRLAEACGHDLVFAAVDSDEISDDEASRLAAHLGLTPAERLDRATVSANFVLRGRQAMKKAGHRRHG